MVISSPLLRAVQTAEVIGGLCDMDVARDPRLTEMALGRWEGMPHDAALVDPDYQSFIDDPDATQVPGGERLSDVRDPRRGPRSTRRWPTTRRAESDRREPRLLDPRAPRALPRPRARQLPPAAREPGLHLRPPLRRRPRAARILAINHLTTIQSLLL